MNETPDTHEAAGQDRPPVADYDHMTVRGLERYTGGLDEDELKALVRYESTHQNRTQVVRLLLARLRHLRRSARGGRSDVQPPRPGPSGGARSGGYGPAPVTSRPGRSIPRAAGAPEPTTLPPPGGIRPRS